ncbi:MAG TPA: NPCBM/NEW2 domain-containing protein [Pirellulales bacterium]
MNRLAAGKRFPAPTELKLMRWVAICGLMLLCAAFAQADDARPEAGQASAARRILEAWRQDRPESGDRYLHVVCWTPNDRSFPAKYEERLDGILKHIQAFYSLQMDANGFGPGSVKLKLGDSGKVVLHAVTGLHPTAHYGKESGGEIRKECVPVLAKSGIDANGETIVIFCNLAQWDAEKLTFKHESPYYAGGSTHSGTAWQLDSPELSIDALTAKEPMIRDGEYGRISLGKHNSIFIGGIAHELGHALSLPHCAPRPDETVRGTPLMGSGNRTYGDELRGEGRGTFLSFAHALRLASHPQFSGSVKELRTVGKSRVSDLAIVDRDNAIEVAGRNTGEPPFSGIVAYFDPAGGGDYNSTTATAVPDEQGRFRFQSDAFPPGKSGELRIVPLHCNGSTGDGATRDKLTFSYEITADGTPDLEAIQLRLALAPFLDALSRRDSATAKRLAENASTPRAKRIAQQLLTPRRQTKTPAEHVGDKNEVSLSQFKPQSAQVGWSKATFDRLPEAPFVLSAHGRIFDTGIYAHAPARHEYALGGKWKRLTGSVSLAEGHDGSVVFEIQGDGKSLWRSDVVEDKIVPFDVDLTDVKSLVLITETTEDGGGSDWGLWLEPQLGR